MTRTFGAWFYCRTCGELVAGPVQRLEDLTQLLLDLPEDRAAPSELLPEGHFVFADRLIEAGLENLGWHSGTLVFHNEDVRRHPTLFIRERFGCCGYWDTLSPNLFCPGGHLIGAEISECCHIQFVAIPLANLARKRPVAPPSEKPAEETGERS